MSVAVKKKKVIIKTILLYTGSQERTGRTKVFSLANVTHDKGNKTLFASRILQIYRFVVSLNLNLSRKVISGENMN